MQALAFFRWLVALSLPASLLLAVADESAAWRAKEMLEPESEARVLKISNTRPGKYPEEVYATVFEFTDVLWFYTASEGTQSLSVVRGRAKDDWQDLERLLREIEPGFAGADELTGPVAPNASGPLPNGCFVESVQELRRRVRSGEHVYGAELLALYFDDQGQTRGHTGLVVSTSKGRFFWDPAEPHVQRSVPEDRDTSPMAVAQHLVPAPLHPLKRARFWRIPAAELRSRDLAAVGRSSGVRQQS